MEEIKEIIMSHCKGIAYPEFELEDLNVMVKEINDHYTNEKSQELAKAKEEIKGLKYRLKEDGLHDADCPKKFNNGDCSVSCGLDELLKEVK